MDNQNQQSPQVPVTTPTPGVSPGATAAVENPVLNNGSNRPIIAKKLQEAYNILITVANDPSVDQLASMIGLTLLLGKMKKHASAVYSGQTPSIIEFLEPEKTIEKTTDSLQDFIIAIDKAKADKLRYKVEDNMVRIFITPYKTSISEKDLNFSLGDLNVDVIVALGVNKQEEIDQAIITHGKILHDATVISLSNSPERQTVGNLNWSDTTASSLSEMVTLLANDMGSKDLIDTQIATALLAGIVSSTKRFANDKTSPTALSISAQLLSSGANQQLVAEKMEPPAPMPIEAQHIQANLPPVVATPQPVAQPAPSLGGQPSLIKSAAQNKAEEAKANIGELDINHVDDEIEAMSEQEKIEKIRIDQTGQLHKLEEGEENVPEVTAPSIVAHAELPDNSVPSAVAPAPPATISPVPAAVAPSISPPVVPNPLSQPHSSMNGYMSSPPSSMMGNEQNSEPADFSEKSSAGQDTRNKFMFTGPGGTSGATDSASAPATDVDTARQAVNSVAQPSFQVPAAFNALPLGNDLHPADQSTMPAPTMPLPTNLVPPVIEPTIAPTSPIGGPTPPPPVPPPIISPLPPSA